MKTTLTPKAHRILVLNAKGGCGKTTVATNLASQYACENQKTVLIDYDPQASSTQWVDTRPNDVPSIESVSAFQNNGQATRTWQLRIPPGTTRVIVDTPARLEAMTAARLIHEADTILIPVMASAIDIRAATQFLKDLMRYPEARNPDKRIAMLGNRVRRRTKAYQQLQAFLDELDIPFLTSLRDTQNYVRAAEEGLGIQELHLRTAQKDCDQWQSLIRWIEKDTIQTSATSC